MTNTITGFLNNNIYTILEEFNIIMEMNLKTINFIGIGNTVDLEI